jgi:hypothetical protein
MITARLASSSQRTARSSTSSCAPTTSPIVSTPTGSLRLRSTRSAIDSFPWVSRGALIPGWSFTAQPDQQGKQFASLLIPTIDSVRCEYNMGLCMSQNRALILVSSPGTAMTSIILSVLNAVNSLLVCCSGR